VNPDENMSNLVDNVNDSVEQYTSYAVADVKNELNVYVKGTFADGDAVAATPAGVEPPLPVPAYTSAAVGCVEPSVNVTQRTFSASVMVNVTVIAVPATSPFFAGCDAKPLLNKSSLVPSTPPLTVEQ
jgi:hypothetical protein